MTEEGSSNDRWFSENVYGKKKYYYTFLGVLKKLITMQRSPDINAAYHAQIICCQVNSGAYVAILTRGFLKIVFGFVVGAFAVTHSHCRRVKAFLI